MTTFYLIRHGAKKKLLTDKGLSKIGKIQAEKTANYIKNFLITHIYSSPSLRTIETAQVISRMLQLHVIEENSLGERMDRLPDQTFKQFIKEWNYATQNPEFKPKGGNSVKETAKKLTTLVYNLTRKFDSGRIVFVTHGGAIRDFLVSLSDEYTVMFDKKLMQAVDECSITKIVFQRKNITVEYADYTDHLK